jgi:hypothetical protein
MKRLNWLRKRTTQKTIRRNESRPRLLRLEDKLAPAVITVTGTGDAIAVDGLVTLREAITSANDNANVNADVVAMGTYGTDTIQFNILGSGVQTISPTSALPVIADPVTIDGYTQPRAAVNTDANGFNGTLLIELDGSNAGSASGLDITAGGSTVRGLVINRFHPASTEDVGNGILLMSNGNLIEGNFIGTDTSGSVALPNARFGISILTVSGNTASNNTIGGLTPDARNVISGNALDAVAIRAFSGSADGNVIEGNSIGTQPNGIDPLGNGRGGVVISSSASASNNIVGGTAPGAGNRIAFNADTGVFISNSGQVVGNSFLSNSIHDNGPLGINLSGGTENSFGVTANDPGDPDTGPNDFQNFPVLTSAVTVGGGTTITGTLNSTLNTTFRVEFFASNAADPSGFGEGQFFLGFTNVTTDGSGNGGFTVSLPVGTLPGQVVAATATDPAGNTSEFSHVAPGPTVLSTQVNDGSAQRSRVTSLSVTFSAQVTFAGTVASAFTLTRTGGGAVSFQASASVMNGVTVVSLDNFTGSETEFGSLKDGRYTLTALANQITLGGQQLDGNGDGTPGDNFTFGDNQGLFRYFGDVNGDQVVNGFDLGLFRNTFGTAVGDPNYLSYFDFNGDGVINGFDLGQFRTRFGTMLP